MTVLDILSYGALSLILFPIISITINTCIEFWFKRKEKHLEWIAEKIKGGKKDG